jgi:DNA (cytosine-5)-methyltransferase 1
VDQIRPRFFLMENVPALQGPRGRPFLKSIIEKTTKAGYILHDAVLNAADYGVPQLRRRFFLVGELTQGLSKFEFPRPECSVADYSTVRDAIGDLPDPELYPKKASKYANHIAGNVSELNRLRLSHVPPGGGREHIPDELRLACHRVSVEVAGHRNVYGRLPWDRPANTITTKCNSLTRGKFGHPKENRNITMREAARLQGFPDQFEFEGNRVDVAHQIGNAVPPPLAGALGRALLATG